MVRAGATNDAATLNLRDALGAWRAAGLRGGNNCTNPQLSNRQLKLWRHCCKQRCRKALEVGTCLRDGAMRQAMDDAVLASGV